MREQFFQWGDGRKLKDVKAVVIHWDASRGVPDLDFLWGWMNRRGEAMRADGETAPYYHYLLSHEHVIHTMDEEKFRAIHCGHRTYRKKAKEFFGERICSPADSPNNHTIGVCMLHDVEGTGGYHPDTMETAIELLAALCVKHKLDPLTKIIRHSDVTNEKEVPCPKAFFEDDDDPDGLFNEFKGWVKIEMDNRFGDPRENKSKERYLK